jgi:hypothetical protein
MQTKFKRHEKVRILRSPDAEYVEYQPDFSESRPEIKAGTIGEINIILPNGQYHVEIKDDSGKTVAYAPFDEDSLESVGD